MSPASAIPAGAEHAVHEVAPWIEKLARLGFAAKALLYMTIGALATMAALGVGRTPQAANAENGTVGSRGAMATLLEAPFGRALVWVIAAGLFGYATWRLLSAIANPERKHGAKGAALRIRDAGLAVLHFGLCYSAIRIAMGSRGAGDDGKEAKNWTARALETPGGEIALYVIALSLAAYGLYQLYKAWRAKLNKHMSLGRLAHRTRKWVIGVSRFGIAARGIVFIATGGLLAKAVNARNPAQAETPSKSLASLFDFGTIPFVIIATGLIAYGVYQLLNAKYRRINVA